MVEMERFPILVVGKHHLFSFGHVRFDRADRITSNCRTPHPWSSTEKKRTKKSVSHRSILTERSEVDPPLCLTGPCLCFSELCSPCIWLLIIRCQIRKKLSECFTFVNIPLKNNRSKRWLSYINASSFIQGYVALFQERENGEGLPPKATVMVDRAAR